MEEQITATKLIFLLIGAASTITGTIIVNLVKRWIEAKVPADKECKLLAIELKDIERHCNENAKVLNFIDLANGIPSSMHLKKMLIPESSIIFSSETYRRIYLEHSELTHELKLIVRNNNIEIQQIIDYQSGMCCERAVLEKYYAHLRSKSKWMADRLGKERKRFMREARIVVQDRNSVQAEESKPKIILYERQFSLVADLTDGLSNASGLLS